MRISIRGLNKADVLAALYNASRPQSAGFLHYRKEPMTRMEAELLLQKGTGFDYLHGRVMKIDLSSDDDFDSWGYDRDNGENAAEIAIKALQTTGDSNSIEVQAMHEVGKEVSAEDVMAHIDEESGPTGRGSYRLGLARLADDLIPAVDRARSKS